MARPVYTAYILQRINQWRLQISITCYSLVGTLCVCVCVCERVSITLDHSCVNGVKEVNLQKLHSFIYSLLENIIAMVTMSTVVSGARTRSLYADGG